LRCCGFLENWGMAKSECCCKVMVEAPNPRDYIPQPWHIYAKCFSTLRCCGWAYGGCTVTLIPLKVRGGFLENMGYG